MNDRTLPVPDVAASSLGHHRRDARTAAALHAVLIVGLIVLWFLSTRSELFDRIVRWLGERLS